MNKDIVDSTILYTGPRGCGQTTSNIGLLLMNPDARLVVHNFNMKRYLSKQYELDENRFITVDELESGKAYGINGPLFFDAPAVRELTHRAYKSGLSKTKTKYESTQDLMKALMEYCKENNVSVMFVPR